MIPQSTQFDYIFMKTTKCWQTVLLSPLILRISGVIEIENELRIDITKLWCQLGIIVWNHRLCLNENSLN